MSCKFREGTIKRACYDALREAGSQGLTVKEIAQAVREQTGGVKLGGATPQNTIVGQLSKDPTFILVKRATYRVAIDGESDDGTEFHASGEREGRNKRAKTRNESESASEKSTGSEFVDANLAYEPGCMVEVARPHKSHGATWASAKVIENDGEFIVLSVSPEGGDDATADVVRLPTRLLASTIRPAPPVENLAVDQSRRLNEEVDVHYNNRWCEGYISQVTDARGKIVVCFPGVGANNDTSLIVFQDSTGQCWIRETWNKTRPKRASIRRGWTLSLQGEWSPRGAPQENGAAAPDSAYKQLAAISMIEAGDSTKLGFKRDGTTISLSEQPSRLESHAATTTELNGSYIGDSAKGVVTSDETDCPFKSISEACYHLLLTAGPEGLQVSKMVRTIQERSLVKLAGKTPANTVYSRLSQDARFVNVSRGAYALESIVADATKNMKTSPQQRSQVDESPKRPRPRISEVNPRVYPMSTDNSAVHRDGLVSATPSIAGDYHGASLSCMSELSNASELLLGLRGKR
ncbi:DNA-directed RNA polymerase delta subunit/Asxl [Ostreococcus tauri]|uniref:DNA-directed RNA polymerase delta subunit/Asxl n=1 Tax=Ostreococcus tauri TaxID=70448 RepID=A0A090M5F6_OSTTA|nr:DNA-directed RNA polymerase delta subunit/Asxl [Ostreococcus tauri]CEF97882.1 DNA-directed RNA polymerase delta subunit/Asxl [Ostreococcus tauri]|eukprot:XP_022838947.1 DNA-directed RNA polymerase delta subunit/Asxl [Ostreococcus tauri]